ncbi:MAG: hypothetical protein AAFV53_20110 [Myxococcota bacterium]
MIWALLLGCVDVPDNKTEPGGGDTAVDTGDMVDDTDADMASGPTFSDDIEPLLRPCVGCHQGEAPDGSFDMSGDDLYGDIVEQPSGQAVDMMLIEPGDHLYSYLWHKLNGSQSVAGGAGTSMPLGTSWTEEQLDQFALWIDLGAQP